MVRAGLELWQNRISSPVVKLPGNTASFKYEVKNIALAAKDATNILPKAQISDLLLNLVYRMTSGEAHLIGNFVPSDAVYSSSMTYLGDKRRSYNA